MSVDSPGRFSLGTPQSIALTRRTWGTEEVADCPGRSLVIAFTATEPYALRQLRAQWIQSRQEFGKTVGRNSKETNRVPIDSMGGAIALLNVPLDLSRPVAMRGELQLQFPHGLCYNPKDKTLYIGAHREIYKLSAINIERIKNPYFNGVHGLCFTARDTLYIACKSIDAVLEMNPSNPEVILWSWFATDHGFDRTPDLRRRKLNKNDLSEVSGHYATQDQTTHLNCVAEFDDNHVLVTLFHQGYLIRICKKTGKFETILEGLRCPHGIKKRDGGFMLSDTDASRILLLDSNLNLVKEISGDFDWIQDSVEFGNLYCAVNGTSGNIDWIDEEGTLFRRLNFDPGECRLGDLCVIDSPGAETIFGGGLGSGLITSSR